MKEITVKKDKLLEALQENKAIHIAEYKEMQVIYLDLALEQAKIMVADLEDKKFQTRLSLDLDKPRSSEDEYERAIEMLAWEVNDTVTITENEYNSYIKDEWNFSRGFALSKAAYLGA